jgi:hypothetical protein
MISLFGLFGKGDQIWRVAQPAEATNRRRDSREFPSPVVAIPFFGRPPKARDKPPSLGTSATAPLRWQLRRASESGLECA